MLKRLVVKHLILPLAVLLACSEPPAPELGSVSDAISLPVARQGAGNQRSPLLRAEACRAKLSEVLARPSLPGAPALEARRAQILGRAKSIPVLFLQEPVWEAEAPPQAEALRRELSEQPLPRTLGRMYRRFHRQPALARAVLLKQGYLYTDEPTLAFALVQKVELSHLFAGEEVVIQRGGELIFASSSGDEYVYSSGASAGEKAKILLFDRVWAKGEEKQGPPLHVDLAPLAESLGFWRARLEHATSDWLVLNLLYGSQWVLSLLSRSGPDVQLECELLEPQLRANVLRARQLEKRRNLLLSQQRRVIQSMIREDLPFDEPRTEEGQQDGKLRPEWRGAYRLGRSTFEFNGDTYPVFDAQGRPRVPQVCIDFIVDTLERASGTWWQPRGQTRQRQLGKLSFDDFEIDNQRSVERFTQFAWDHPEQFDVYSLPSDQRVPLRQGDEFFAHIEQHAARYRPGDVISILGLRSDEKHHYHAFFVYQADPVSGMPIWLASNAGRPRLRSWYAELLTAPRRSIKSRIRPRLEWLESISDDVKPLASEPTGSEESSG